VNRNLIILPMVSILWAFAPRNPRTLPTKYDSSATFTGYPMPHSSDAPVNSLTFDDYVLPLAFNLACYAVVALVLLWLWRAVPFFHGRWLNAGLAWVVWLLGAVFLFPFLMLTAIGDIDLHFWYDEITWAALKERLF
jgi:hypothetical protein